MPGIGDAGRVFGKARVLRKAGALDTRPRRSESQLPQECICQAALSGNSLGCADDNGPDTQEPDASKDPSPVL